MHRTNDTTLRSIAPSSSLWARGFVVECVECMNGNELHRRNGRHLKTLCAIHHRLAGQAPDTPHCIALASGTAGTSRPDSSSAKRKIGLPKEPDLSACLITRPALTGEQPRR